MQCFCYGFGQPVQVAQSPCSPGLSSLGRPGFFDDGPTLVIAGSAWCTHAVAPTLDEIAEQLRSAFATKDLDAFGQLLAEDARWGDDNHPNRCRGRSDVIATFDRLLGEGVDGDVIETIIGPKGIAVRLHVHWPNPGEGRGINFYQAYLVSAGLVTEIQRHDDRKSAVAAVAG